MDDIYKEEEENSRYITIISNQLRDDLENEIKTNGDKTNLTSFDIDRLDFLIAESQRLYEEGDAENIASIFNELNKAVKFSPQLVLEHIWNPHFSSMLFDSYQKMSGTDYFLSVLELITTITSLGSTEVKDICYQNGFLDTTIFEASNTTNKNHIKNNYFLITSFC